MQFIMLVPSEGPFRCMVGLQYFSPWLLYPPAPPSVALKDLKLDKQLSDVLRGPVPPRPEGDADGSSMAPVYDLQLRHIERCGVVPPPPGWHSLFGTPFLDAIL